MCVRRSVRAGVHCAVRSAGDGRGLSSTALELPGQCLELSGRAGRRPDVVVDASVRGAAVARCHGPVEVLRR